MAPRRFRYGLGADRCGDSRRCGCVAWCGGGSPRPTCERIERMNETIHVMTKIAPDIDLGRVEEG